MHFFAKRCLTFGRIGDIMKENMRKWRNGRRAGLRSQYHLVCGFKSHFPHQRKKGLEGLRGTERTSSGRPRPRTTKGARRPRIKSHFPHQRKKGLEGLRGTERTSSGRPRPRTTKGARRPRIKSHFPHQRKRGLEGLRGTERTSSGRPRPRTTKGARRPRIKSHFPHQRKRGLENERYNRERPRAAARESSPIFRTSGKQIPRPKSSCNCGSNRLHLFCAANLLSVSPYPKRCRCSVFSYQKEEVPP